MNDDFFIEIYNNAKRLDWDNFVASSKNGTFLFFRNYMEYHADKFKDFSLLIYDPKGVLIALLPANIIEGNIVCSHGGLTYGGFICDHRMRTGTMVEIFDKILKFFYEKNINKFNYKTIPYIYHSIPSEEDRYALFLSSAKLYRRDVLTVLYQERKIQFQERRKRCIKKAEKGGINIIVDGDLKTYWEILTNNLEQNYKSKPVHSISEIEYLKSKFNSNIKLFSAYLNNKIIAGVVVYESSQVAHIQYIASDEVGKEIGALDFIFNFLINNYYNDIKFIDFGISNENNGLYLNRGLIEHKEGFGARAVVHDFYEITIK